MREARSLLPVHGFVLAGGKSSRMGRDKALLPFRGRPMVEIAVEKLRSFCGEVSIAGNREDLAGFAPVVPEVWLEVGPAAGIEAGLRASSKAWAMFLPVDVPLLPAEMLRGWAEAVLVREGEGVRLSYLRLGEDRHPAICMVHRECGKTVAAAVRGGMRRLAGIFDEVSTKWEGEAQTVWACEAGQFAPELDSGSRQMELWFSNVNSPGELAAAEALPE